MNRRWILLAVAGVALAALVSVVRRDRAAPHYTGFVEGEERVLRSEVAGRVIEVKAVEGAPIEPDAVVAVLDDRDVQARLRSKQEEIEVLEANIRTQRERVELVQTTWVRDRGAREADVRQAESAADLAQRNYVREAALVETGASTRQLLDDARARLDESKSVLDRARQMLARTNAEERTIAVAKHELAALEEQHELAGAQLGELQVLAAKYVVHAPAVRTVVQTQFIWPGELAQPGTAIVAVLDPRDKYVQIYLPAADVGRMRVGRRVSIELDSAPGKRFAGEVSFIADQASFTPEKIETRSDRLGQVYRAKVRILENVERFQPGTEGNVYFAEEEPARAPKTAADGPRDQDRG